MDLLMWAQFDFIFKLLKWGLLLVVDLQYIHKAIYNRGKKTCFRCIQTNGIPTWEMVCYQFARLSWRCTCERVRYLVTAVVIVAGPWVGVALSDCKTKCLSCWLLIDTYLWEEEQKLCGEKKNISTERERRGASLVAALILIGSVGDEFLPVVYHGLHHCVLPLSIHL